MKRATFCAQLQNAPDSRAFAAQRVRGRLGPPFLIRAFALPFFSISFARFSFFGLSILYFSGAAAIAAEDSAPPASIEASSVLPPEPTLDPNPTELPKPAALPSLPQPPSALHPEAPIDELAPSTVLLHPWRVDLGLETSVTYDDNVFIQHHAREDDVYFGITPVVVITWGRPQVVPRTLTGDINRFLQGTFTPDLPGDSLLIRYSPTATFFTRHGDQNAFDEDLEVNGRIGTAKSLLEIEARYQTLSSPDIDVGNRIEREKYSAFLDWRYNFTAKTSIDSRLDFDHENYHGGLNFTDVGERVTLNYKLTPKTTVGMGAAFGFTNVEAGADQTYEQGLLHVHYTPTEKIGVDFLGGVEARQISHGAVRTTPVFAIQASYALGNSTAILLNASRRTETSAEFEQQDIERTIIEANLRQYLFQKVSVTIGGGYQHAQYVDAGTVTSANRTDDFGYFGVSSAVDINRWCSLRMGYRYQNNHSSFSDFSFGRNVADIQLNVQF